MPQNELEAVTATTLPFPHPPGYPSLATYSLLEALRNRQAHWHNLGGQ